MYTIRSVGRLESQCSACNMYAPPDKQPARNVVLLQLQSRDLREMPALQWQQQKSQATSYL